MKRIIALSIIVLLSINLWAQPIVLSPPDQFIHINTSLTSSNTGEIIIPEGLAEINPIDSTEYLYSRVLIFDPISLSYQTRIISQPDSIHQLVLQYVNWSNGRYDCFGYAINSITGDGDAIMLQLDTSFCILNFQIFGLPTHFEYLEDLEVLPQGYIITLSAYKAQDELIRVFKIDTNFNVVDSVSFSNTLIVTADQVYNPYTNKILVCTDGAEEWYLLDYETLDLDTSGYYNNIPNLWNPASPIKLLGPSKYYQPYYKRKYMAGSLTNGWKLGYMFRDSLGTIYEQELSDFSQDTTEIVPDDCILVVSPDTLITCVMKSIDFDYANFAPESILIWYIDSWVSIYAHSPTGEVYWRLSFGGDMHWQPTMVYGANDGTFYLLGWYSDISVLRPNFYWFLMRSDKDGKILSRREFPANQTTLQLAPNPSSTFTRITSTLPYHTSRIDHISILDMSGKLILSTAAYDLGDGFILETSGLDNGTYIVQITYFNGHTEATKLIVQQQ